MSLESHGLATTSVVAATTAEVFDSDDVTGWLKVTGAPDNLEGLAVINRSTVAIVNDDDFGISHADDATRIWILRLKAPLF